MPQLHRNRPAQIIAAEIQPLEVGQVPQAGISLNSLPKRFKVGQVPQFGRDHPTQLVGAESLWRPNSFQTGPLCR